MKYKHIGINIKTKETIEFVGSKQATDAGFHYGHISECANGGVKSHKGYIWIKVLIKGVSQ